MKFGRTSEQVVLIIETEHVEVPVGMFNSGSGLDWTLEAIVLLRLVLCVSRQDWIVIDFCEMSKHRVNSFILIFH